MIGREWDAKMSIEVIGSSDAKAGSSTLREVLGLWPGIEVIGSSRRSA